jgi:hypothetical protein
LKEAIEMSYQKRFKARCAWRVLLKLPAVVALVAAGWLPAAVASAADKPAPRAAKMVQETLAAEVQGAASREGRLAKIIEMDPDYAPARWAAGYVEQEGKWGKFDSLTNDADENESLAEYRQLRAKTSDDADGQLKLANWCLRSGLKEQERAHLLRVLDFEPNNAELRKRLGMVQLGGVWMQPDEARRAAARGKQAAADLKGWTPKMEKFRTALSGPAGRVRELAAEHVRAISDPSAILALETVLAPSSDVAGLAVVDALTAMHRPDAAIALARLASFSNSSETMDASREKLKTLPMGYYVPAMLASLVAPETQAIITTDRFGRLLFQQAFVFEGVDRRQIAVFDDAYGVDSGVGVLTASALAKTKKALRTAAIDPQNRQFERTNKRIIETLGEVTGQTLAANPKDWWSWWNEINEVEIEKRTDVTFVDEFTNLRIRISRVGSCLIAGTPIWTNRGQVAVEMMEMGDRVLARDPVSGELAYKPVLGTTIRQRAALVHISLPDEQIVASGGHPFWVAGKGWVNARHLAPDMRIYTTTGTAAIKSIKIEEAGGQPVYNLIVADFHNYFAGNSHLLLHDPTPCEPALGPVPGWQN